MTGSAEAGVGGALVAEVLETQRPRLKRTRSALWSWICSMPRPSNCSGEACLAIHSPTTPTRTSRIWIRAWRKCSRTSLQALRRSNGQNDDSPTVHLGLSGTCFGGYSFACGQLAARGNGQPEIKGLDQRGPRETPRPWPDFHSGQSGRRDVSSAIRAWRL